MRSLARTFTAALALTLASFGLASPANAAAGFGDVEAGQWFTEPIAWMVSESITNGTSPGCFSPQDAVTRGQIVTFMFRLDQARGNEPESAPHPFTDVVAAYQNEPIGWAFSSGVTTGTSATTFAPDASITRGDFAALLWRYAGQPSASAPHPFTDVTKGYQQAAIGWMAERGITTGTTPTTFSPDGNMTRAEAATFFFRFMDEPAVAELSAVSPCFQDYVDLLVAAGLTLGEAECMVPFLVEDVDLAGLASVINGSTPLEGDILVTVAAIISAGCISDDRQPDVIRIFL